MDRLLFGEPQLRQKTLEMSKENTAPSTDPPQAKDSSSAGSSQEEQLSTKP